MQNEPTDDVSAKAMWGVSYGLWRIRPFAISVGHQKKQEKKDTLPQKKRGLAVWIPEI